MGIWWEWKKKVTNETLRWNLGIFHPGETNPMFFPTSWLKKPTTSILFPSKKIEKLSLNCRRLDPLGATEACTLEGVPNGWERVPFFPTPKGLPAKEVEPGHHDVKMIRSHSVCHWGSSSKCAAGAGWRHSRLRKISPNTHNLQKARISWHVYSNKPF